MSHTEWQPQGTHSPGYTTRQSHKNNQVYSSSSVSVHHSWCKIKIIHHTTLYLHGDCKAKHKKEWISKSKSQTEILKFSDYKESQEKMEPHQVKRLKQSLLWTQVTDSK